LHFDEIVRRLKLDSSKVGSLLVNYGEKCYSLTKALTSQYILGYIK